VLQLCAVGDIMKINIKTTLNNVNTNEKNSIETKGILSGDTIVYYDQNIMMSLDLKERTLKRRSKEYEIILDFIKNKCFYIMNGNKMMLDIKVNEMDDSFYVDYEIEDNHIIYSLKYEVL